MKKHSNTIYIIIAGLIAGFYATANVSTASLIVHAVVREIKDHPEYPPEGRSEDSSRPPVWEATLVIDKVLAGPEELLGQEMYVMTNNKLFGFRNESIIPKLKVGEEGIWSTSRAMDGKLYNLGRPLEFVLPLIKGRDADYEKMLTQLSAGAPNALPWNVASNYPGQIPPESSATTPRTPVVKPQATVSDAKPTPENTPSPASAPPSREPQTTTLEPSSESSQSWRWPVVIVAALGLLWALLKKRK